MHIICYFIFAMIVGSCMADEEIFRPIMRFNDKPRGGNIVLHVPCLSLWNDYAYITTSKDDTNEDVLKRMALYGSATGIGISLVRNEEGVLGLKYPHIPLLAIGGSEDGLGIPEPIYDLSGAYICAGSVAIYWNNNIEYDSIGMIQHGMRRRLIGDMNKYEWEVNYHGYPREHGVAVGLVGYVNDTPSNGAHVLIHACSQEDLLDMPYRNGVAPNWKLWGHPDIDYAPLVKEGTGIREAEEYVAPYYYRIVHQSMHGTQDNTCGGVYRKYLGLHEEHTYRLSVHMNTRNNPISASWEYSLHVIVCPTGVAELSPAQMAGNDLLSDGSTGEYVGMVATYGKNKVTGGKWERQDIDIRIPEGSDSIFIWMRVKGNSPEPVGLDWTILQDYDCDIRPEQYR